MNNRIYYVIIWFISCFQFLFRAFTYKNRILVKLYCVDDFYGNTKLKLLHIRELLCSENRVNCYLIIHPKKSIEIQKRIVTVNSSIVQFFVERLTGSRTAARVCRLHFNLAKHRRFACTFCARISQGISHFPCIFNLQGKIYVPRNRPWRELFRLCCIQLPCHIRSAR